MSGERLLNFLCSLQFTTHQLLLRHDDLRYFLVARIMEIDYYVNAEAHKIS